MIHLKAVIGIQISAVRKIEEETRSPTEVPQEARIPDV
jgi:hypothetical protein